MLSVPVSLIRHSDYQASVVFPNNGSMIRHPASLDRVPVGPVPLLRRYYQDATISCLPSRRTSFPSLGGTTVASAIRSVWLEMPKPPAGGIRAFAGHPPSRPSCRGKGRTSQVPARPQWPVRHALRLRRNRTRLAIIVAATWPPLREPRRLPQWDFRSSIPWLSGSLSTLRSAGYPNTTQDSLPAVG